MEPIKTLNEITDKKLVRICKEAVEDFKNRILNDPLASQINPKNLYNEANTILKVFSQEDAARFLGAFMVNTVYGEQ